MIEVERLSKRFGPVTAVDDLSFGSAGSSASWPPTAAPSWSPAT